MWRFNTACRQPEKLPGEGEEASTSSEEQPTCLDTSDFGKFLDVCKDKLTVRYTGNGLHDNDVGSIQANRRVPCKQLVYYYEMLVIDAGERGLIAIGFAEKGFKMGRHPGWEPNSYGYHADDGKKLTGVVTPNRNGGEDYGPPFSAGDTVGAGIFLERQEMFFTRNGQNLGVAFRNVLKVPLYPTVGLHSRSEQVEVNFGQKPFAFDLDALVQEERRKREAAVQSVQVPSGVSHQIIQDYLLHFGYADTLRSFVESAGLSGPDSSGPSTSGSGGGAAASEDLLQLRHSLREKFMAGRVDEACKLLEQSKFQHFLGSLPEHSGPDLDVYFFIKCLEFIELIRNRKIVEAVDFARQVLSPLRGVFASRSTAYDAMLADVVALLAYVNPEASSMKALLEQGQREAVADMVNAAILESSQHSHGRQERPQAALEKLLMQLVAVQDELHAANGGHGQLFRLLDHLLAPAPRLPHIANGTTENGVSGHATTANGTATNGVAHME